MYDGVFDFMIGIIIILIIIIIIIIIITSVIIYIILSCAYTMNGYPFS